MRAEVYFTPQQTDELSLRDKTVVVTDVLRASTSIITALSNGAKEVIPVTTVESAMKISGNLAGEVILLGGERNGKKIEGFNLGNSPTEYNEENVRNKSIIFSTTNGSQAMVKARFAREMAVLGFVNVSAVTGFLRQTPRDFVVICSGRNGMFSMEDAVCAGMLLHRLADDESSGLTTSDGAQAALALYKSYGKNILKMIRNTDHGKYLETIGFGNDLALCAGVDTVPVLPLLDGNVIKLKRDNEQKDGNSGPQPQ